MRAAIIGSGGRESALAWAVAKSPLVEKTYRYPYVNLDQAAECCAHDRPDLVIVGPEAALVDGIVNWLEALGIPAFGPSIQAAQLEASKIFTKELCTEQCIPTARWWSSANFEHAARIICGLHYPPPVVKADGLCGGKGVVVASSTEAAVGAAYDMLVKRKLGDAGSRIVIEDRLEGRECSMMFLCQGETAIPLPPARDYKRAENGDKGPNTGGMGAYSPCPDVDDALVERVRQEIILPALRGMKARGTPFRGLLYAGLMLTAEGPMLLEFNVRFGDPETQALLLRLVSDLVPYLNVIARNEPGGLARLEPLSVRDEAAVCVTIACEGYPEKPKTGGLITDEGGHAHDAHLFWAGMRLDEGHGGWVTTGGRVASVVGLGATIAAARERAYARAACIHFDGKYLRTDIAHGV